ncbi:MAG TPA: hypothetical protein VFE47_05280 [Tepidisphaeraceae bacterium]|jgi:molybdate transport system regulatory protein|nr:hypothetical protein [Tepidisphaeraceae bacterium]
MPRQSSKLPPRALRAQVWVECNGKPALSEASADLLTQIDATGSLSQAARQLRFSYRRAWMLLDSVNKGWPTPLVITATGGHKGGGARLTELGHHVLRVYRDLQLQIEHLLDQAGDPFEPMP